MSQLLLPIDEFNLTGGVLFGAASEHEAIDGSFIGGDDDAYMVYTVNGTLGTDLSTPAFPIGSHADHKILIRSKNLGSTKTSKVKITLSEFLGGFLFAIRFVTTIVPTDKWETLEIDIPLTAFGSLGTGANSINDYSVLNLVIQVTTGAGEEVRINRLALEVPAMVDLHLTRHSAEVLAKKPAPLLLATRESVEVLAKKPAVAGLSLTRFTVEVLAKVSAAMHLTRHSAEVLAKKPTPSLSLTRLSLEVLARNIYLDTLNTGPLPTPLPTFLVNNWLQTVELESSWNTDVAEAESVSEERVGSTDRPERSLTLLYTGMTKKQSTALWMSINRQSKSQLLAPLFQDVTAITASSSGSTIWCNTTKRRFYLGGFIVFYQVGSDGEPANVQYGKILTVFDDHITTTVAIVGTYTTGYVFPAIRTEINLGASGHYHTDQNYEVAVTLKEPFDDSALFALPDPTGLSTFEGYPILVLDPNWSDGIDANILRAGEQFESGSTSVVSVRGDRPQAEHALDLSPLSRDEAWPFLQFFDYRKGRQRPFCYISPATLFDVVAASTTTLDILPVGLFQDLADFLELVGIIKTNGTPVIARILTTEDHTTFWRLTFADVGTALSAGVIKRATSAHLARFSSDTIKETWHTDGVCEIQASMRDLLEEKNVPIPGLDVSIDLVEIVDIPDLWLIVDSDHYTWGDIGANRSALALQDEDIEFWDDIRASPSEPYLERDTPSGADHWGLFTDTALNQGRPACQAQGESFIIKGANRKFFGAGGMTIVINARMPSVDYAVIQPMRRYFEQTGVLIWTDRDLKLFETIDIVNANFQNLAVPRLFTGELHTMILRWEPGVSVKIISNGTTIATTAASPSVLPDDQTRDAHFHSTHTHDTSPPVFSNTSSIARNTYYNSMMIFRRALTTAEMNTIGKQMKNRYGGSWNVIP